MTARKRFKQRVRARAAKTGESYAVARRQLDHRPGQEPKVPEFRNVTNTLHGFAIDLPEGWREVPPEALATHWQVASFEAGDGSGAGAAVLASPSGDQPAAVIAAATRAAYEAQGMDTSGGPERFADGDGYRLEGRRATATGELTLIDYIVVSADRAYRLVLTTSDIDRDRATFAEIAASFKIIEATAPLPDASPPPALTDRARKVVVLAAGAASELHVSTPTTAHLFYGLVAEGDGMAAVVLRDMGLDAGRVKSALAGSHQAGDATSAPDESDLKELLTETAPTIARDLGHYYIGTEHLLLAVLRSENRGSALARELGVDFGAVRSRIAALLTESLNRQVTGTVAQ